jgi:ferric-dicitrate binding protein FerR (iron transport regulator)
MSDPDLKRAFARLRDADRGQTPPFDAMRTRALARSRAETPPRRAWPTWRLAGVAAAAVAIAVCAAVWIGPSQSAKKQAEFARSSSARQVEQLIAKIDAHLAARLALFEWESPTDFLLTQEPSTPENPATP